MVYIISVLGGGPVLLTCARISLFGKPNGHTRSFRTPIRLRNKDWVVQMRAGGRLMDLACVSALVGHNGVSEKIGLVVLQSFLPPAPLWPNVERRVFEVSQTVFKQRHIPVKTHDRVSSDSYFSKHSLSRPLICTRLLHDLPYLTTDVPRSESLFTITSSTRAPPTKRFGVFRARYTKQPPKLFS